MGDIAFLKTMLCTLLSAKDGNDAKTQVAMTMAVTQYNRSEKGVLGYVARECSPELQRNFLTGYKSAIKKYGPDLAKERMENYLVDIILKNTNITREKLMKQMLSADVMSRMVVHGGFNFEKDEDGNYHEI